MIILNGRVRNNQLFLDILTPSLRNNFDNNGESKYMPKKDMERSKSAYPTKRKDLKYSSVIICVVYNKRAEVDILTSYLIQ